jgi:YggT family protein
MLIRILSFLLDTLFFVLMGSALLRAWMNRLRINMHAQPGVFVMAVSDWLVKPLRRALPKSVAQSRVDWASLMAALLLALLYAVLWAALVGALLNLTAAMLPALLLTGLKMLLRVAFQLAFAVVLVYALISWLQPGSPMYGLLGRLAEPLLTPLRRFIPSVGGVDLSALVLLLLLQIGLMVLG